MDFALWGHELPAELGAAAVLNTNPGKLLQGSSLCNIYLHVTLTAGISVFKLLKRSSKKRVVPISSADGLESKVFLDYLSHYLGHYLGWFVWK